MTEKENKINNLITAIVGKVASLISTHNSDTNSHSDIRNAINNLSTSGPVTVEKQDEAETGYVATYVIKQNGNQVGSKINIPKDFLVKSGTVETCVFLNQPVGCNVGDKYIDLIINTKANPETDEHIYIKVTDLIDTYEGDDAGTITITDNKIGLSTSIKNTINGKVNTSQGSANANKNVVTNASGNITMEAKPTIPTKTSDLINDSNYIQKSSTAGLIKNNGSIDTNTYVNTNDGRLSDSRVPKFTQIPATMNPVNVVDLNSDEYRVGGFYYIGSDNNAHYVINCPNSMGSSSNAPYNNNDSFFMLVETWGVRSVNYLKQTLTYYKTNETYTRTYKNGAWVGWTKLSQEGHKHTKSDITNFSHNHELNDINVTNIASAVDYNTLKTQKMYKVYYTIGKDCANRPEDIGGLLLVEDIANGVSQTFYRYGGEPTIYYRTYYSPDDVWSNWKRMVWEGHGHKETELNWQGSTKDSVPPITQASIDEFSANRLAYFQGTIDIRYSTNNGSTYTVYPNVTTAQKMDFVTRNCGGFRLGNNDTTDYSKNRLYVDLDFGNQGKASVIYCTAQKLLIEMGTMGATGCKVHVHTLAYKNGATWEEISGSPFDLGGWTNWNAIPLNKTVGGSASQTGTTSNNVKKIRLTFVQSGGTANALITGLKLIAPKLYNGDAPYMALRGHLYNYDSEQNAYFPGKIVRIGGYSSQVLKANGDVGTVVDNLTTGGSGNVLSAEQGKTLKGLVDGKISNGTGTVTSTNIADRSVTFEKMQPTIYWGGGSGSTAGYIKMIKFKFTSDAQWRDKPITFDLYNRQRKDNIHVSLKFKNVGTNDPDVDYFSYTSYDTVNLYIYKEETSTWSIIIQKESNGNMEIMNLTIPNFNRDYLAYYNMNTQISKLPSNTTANPLIQATQRTYGGTSNNNITAPAFIKSGGTSAQFLKANGSVETLNTTACTVTYTNGRTGTINLVTR